MRKIIYAAAVALAMLTPPLASAQDVVFKAVGDKDSVALDPSKSYLIVQMGSASSMYSFPLTFLRRPEQADVDAYLASRAAALTKAHDKWVRKHAQWTRDVKEWDGLAPSVRRTPRPVEPVEPTDANLAFPALDQLGMITVGPFNRFSKAGGKSTFLSEMKPGRYAFYGPMFAGGIGGTCLCMGTIEFDLKPGQILNAGTVRFNFMDERKKAKDEGRAVPKTELDLPDDLNAITWLPAEPGAAVDPRLAAYTIVPAELHASGRIPNYYGVTIDRLTPVPGVLSYDRDKVIDVKTGKAVR